MTRGSLVPSDTNDKEKNTCEKKDMSSFGIEYQMKSTKDRTAEYGTETVLTIKTEGAILNETRGVYDRNRPKTTKVQATPCDVIYTLFDSVRAAKMFPKE
uniref:Reverse transcriptase domain-containing protein n=1 Tax=Steinernema glaseri TaxID=37863 RepID=A0A1I8ADX6_9BILA